ncbi:MAG TPA: glutathione S-transferase family protein [Caulobacter sp.]|nr:glutathione S-transferase family protein [Caulobacter sp.]
MSETSQLRIFTYLPNPRIWKATIAARLCGIDVEVRGVAPVELRTWLWDFDARPLTEGELEGASGVARTGKTGYKGQLYKTDAFLKAHPFGTVPAAFSPDGNTGVFESNSIMRAVARLGAEAFPLYGHDAYSSARIDSFLDVSLVFASASQRYLLALSGGSVSTDLHAQVREALTIYVAGIDQALAARQEFLVGENITLADICFVAELSLFRNERALTAPLAAAGLTPVWDDKLESEYPRAFAHFVRLCAHPAISPDAAPYLAKLDAAA